MADWQAIKTEYITTDTSYRKLAQKYGVSHVQIGNVGKEEKWVELRRQYLDKTFAKTVEKISQQEASRAAKIYSVADKLLLQIDAMVSREEPLDEKTIRMLTASVKDLKEIHGVKSTLDEQEQRARIANLRKQAESEQHNDTPKLVVEGLPEEFKV